MNKNHHHASEICGRILHHKHFSTELYSVMCRACFVKESHMPALTTTDLTAFCSTCPAAAEVTEALTLLGFALVFQLDADDNQAYLHLAPLPPQFHYRNDHGTEVVYLAGVEQEDKQPAPQHASRFWLYVG